MDVSARRQGMFGDGLRIARCPRSLIRENSFS
jgi:hypothetical protein